MDVEAGSLVGWAGLAAECAPDALLVVDGDGSLLWGSPSAATLLGHDPVAAVGTNVFERVHPDDLGYAAGALHETVRKDGLHIPVQIRVAHGDGHWVSVEITANTPMSSDGERRIVLALRPIDPRLVLPERRREFEGLLDGVARRCGGATWQAVNGIVTDALGRLGDLLHASRTMFALVDHPSETITVEAAWNAPDVLPVAAGTTTAELVDLNALGAAIDDGFRYTENVALEPCGSQALRNLGVHSELVVPVAPDGVLLAVLTVHWASSADQCWDDALGTYVQAFGQVLTATVQRSRSEAVVHHRALHDPLTGLANRSLLLADVRDGLSRLTNRDRGGLAVLYCDLDGFKHVNDDHGHEVGDRTLIDIADRIRSQLRPGDEVGRIGGDEFVVLCQRIEDPDLAEEVATRIRAAVVNRPPPGLTDPLDISIGIAWTNQPGDAEDLLREADQQMYLVKRTRSEAD